MYVLSIVLDNRDNAQENETYLSFTVGWPHGATGSDASKAIPVKHPSN